MRKQAFIGIMVLFFFVESKAQWSASAITEKYEAYQVMWGRTKPHLVLNQEKYAPGDTILFKAYFLREDLTRVRGKQILEVNLVDASGHAATGVKFYVNNGMGRDQLIIPNNLTAGVYYLTAHNNWMKNFDPAFIFKKKISIVKKNEVVEVKKPFLYAAPEGGHLISGIANQIRFYTHQPGIAVQVKDDAGKEIGRVMMDGNGTGSLLLNPVANTRYTAHLRDGSMHVLLPAVDADGVSFTFRQGGKGQPHDIILTSAVTSSYIGKELLVVMTAAGKIQWITTVKHSQRDSLTVKSSEMIGGLVQITVLDPTGSVLASRNFYNYKDPTVRVKVDPDQAVYHTRDKINLAISITDQAGKPAEGEFSVRVVNAALFEEEAGLFSEELTLLTEVKTPYELNRNQEGWQTSLDNFLITVTEPLPWPVILAKQLPTPTHLFSNVIEKRGKAYFADSDKPLPDLTQVSFYLQRNREYVQTFTTDQGTIGFSIPQFYGNDELYYIAQLLSDDDITDIRVEWEKDIFPWPEAPGAIESERSDDFAVFMERKRLIDQSFGVHQHLNDVTSNNTKDINDIWEADVTVKVDDYIVFPTLKEFIKEVVPAMYYRNTKRGDVVRVTLPAPMQATTSPLYIIDGIATRNTAFFLSLKPAEIRTFKIINTRSKLSKTGLLGKYGIVIVETQKGNLREPLLDPDNKLLIGLDLPLPFNTYIQPAAYPNVPDFRSTLYWNPSVKTEADGKATLQFYGSDDIGKFRIYVEGLSAEARPFAATQDIHVEVAPIKN